MLLVGDQPVRYGSARLAKSRVMFMVIKGPSNIDPTVHRWHGVEATPTATREMSSHKPYSDQADTMAHQTLTGIPSWSVRRLTPMECERLQGFPESWTLLPPTVPDTPPSETP